MVHHEGFIEIEEQHPEQHTNVKQGDTSSFPELLVNFTVGVESSNKRTMIYDAFNKNIPSPSFPRETEGVKTCISLEGLLTMFKTAEISRREQ